MNKIINDFIFEQYENMYPLVSYNEDEFKFGEHCFSSETSIESYSQLVSISLKNIIDSQITNEEIVSYLYHNLDSLLNEQETNKENLYYIIERCYGYFENNFIINPAINITVDLKLIILQSIFNYLKSFPVTYSAYLLTLSKDEIEEIHNIMNKIEKPKVYAPQLLYKSIIQVSLNNQNYTDILVNLILQSTDITSKFISLFYESNMLDNYLETLSRYISINDEMVYLSKVDVRILLDLDRSRIINMKQTNLLISDSIVTQLQLVLREACLNSFSKLKK